MPTERFKTHAAVYLILKRDNKILMHLRQNTGFADGMYSLVAGHLDGNESAKQAMIREAKEEAGITIDPKNLKFAHAQHVITDKEYVVFYFVTDKWTGDITNMEPEKCAALTWFPIDALPQETVPLVRIAISSYLDNQLYSEYGF